MARHDNILQTIGRTPLVRLNRLAPAGAHLYVKVESFNPLGSVKDRMALAVIEDAERRGTLRPGQTVVEATSGNTGIGLAMVCAQKGYPLVVTMAESFSVERRRLLRQLLGPLPEPRRPSARLRTTTRQRTGTGTRTGPWAAQYMQTLRAADAPDILAAISDDRGERELACSMAGVPAARGARTAAGSGTVAAGL